MPSQPAAAIDLDTAGATYAIVAGSSSLVALALCLY
jgi:hypothetical protein